MQIIDYQPTLPGQYHKAEFSIYFPAWGMTFRRWKLVMSRQGNYFVTSPAFSTEQDDGKRQWHSYIEFSSEKKKDFDRKILEALKPFLENKPQQGF